MRRVQSTVVIPADAAPRCGCGLGKVSVYRDGIERLIDNMGCELGLEFVAGPFCPRCDRDAVERARLAGGPRTGL